MSEERREVVVLVEAVMALLAEDEPNYHQVFVLLSRALTAVLKVQAAEGL